jgi:hypothetical protein
MISRIKRPHMRPATVGLLVLAMVCFCIVPTYLLIQRGPIPERQPVAPTPSSWGTQVREPNVLYPPLYPNAAQVDVQYYPEAGWLEMRKSISFETTASPSEVASFYVEAMQKEGWVSGVSSSASPSPEGPIQLEFLSFINSGSHPHWTDVKIFQSGDNVTHVELRIE